MLSDYLYNQELKELTGCGFRKDQLAWLRSRGWAHEITGRGEIRVLRAYRDAKMGLGKLKEVERKMEPDFSGPNFRRVAA